MATPGKRFSLIYLERGAPEKDSKTARFRISKICEKSCSRPSTSKYGSGIDYRKRAIEDIETELGIRFATRAQSGTLVSAWDWYFNRVTKTEMLDTITVVANSLHSEYEKYDRKKAFLDRVRIVFSEENLAYKIDETGTIHPLIDSAFSADRASAIAMLNTARYEATAAYIDDIDNRILQDPPDYKGAIRSIFGANENLFKLMYGAIRLDSKSAGHNIGKDLQTAYQGHPNLQASTAKLLESFKDWINAAHFYRHEEGVEEPNQPTEEIAILIISQGISFVRWLAHIDKIKSS